jgi:hypothetical protein
MLSNAAHPNDVASNRLPDAWCVMRELRLIVLETGISLAMRIVVQLAARTHLVSWPLPATARKPHFRADYYDPVALSRLVRVNGSAGS